MSLSVSAKIRNEKEEWTTGIGRKQKQGSSINDGEGVKDFATTVEKPYYTKECYAEGSCDVIYGRLQSIHSELDDQQQLLESIL